MRALCFATLRVTCGANEDVPRVLAAIKAQDGERLDAALTRLHASCVDCHKAEKVLYFKDAVERIRDRSK